MPTATVTATRRPTARERLFAEMEKLFAEDAGLGALVPYNGRPDMTGQAKDIQTAWARALIAAHGRDRAASVYTEYADRRQGTVTERVGSWDNLVLATSPIPRWRRDVHGFMCFGCTDSFATVTTPERDGYGLAPAVAVLTRRRTPAEPRGLAAMETDRSRPAALGVPHRGHRPAHLAVEMPSSLTPHAPARAVPRR